MFSTESERSCHDAARQPRMQRSMTAAGRKRAIACLTAIALLGATQLMAQGTLGSAQAFGVLGASTVTNTGPTTITGDLGVWPGTAITGQGSITLNGMVHAADAVAHQAQNDANTAYTNLAARPFTANLTGQDLGGLTLTPGVYFFSSSAQLTGSLFLNFLGNQNSTFVFQIGSTLTTASGSLVSETNGGPGGNVFWQVGSAATLGTGTAFEGNIIAKQSVTLTRGATISCGSAIALNGAVTMDTNVISDQCASGTGASGTPGTPITTPEPSSMALLGSGLVGLIPMFRRRRKS